MHHAEHTQKNVNWIFMPQYLVNMQNPVCLILFLCLSVTMQGTWDFWTLACEILGHLPAVGPDHQGCIPKVGLVKTLGLQFQKVT